MLDKEDKEKLINQIFKILFKIMIKIQSMLLEELGYPMEIWDNWPKLLIELLIVSLNNPKTKMVYLTHFLNKYFIFLIIIFSLEGNRNSA